MKPTRRLIYLKELVEHARDHASIRTPMDASIAIHNMHMACEWLFRIVLNDWDSKFSNLLDKIINKYKSLEEYKEDLNELNRLRNAIQHKDEFYEPDLAYVELLCDSSEQAIKNLIKEHFKMDYDEISSTISILDEKWQNEAKRAENAYLNANYRECLDICNTIINEIIEEAAGISGMVTGILADVKLAEVIDDRYKERYFTAECKTLAEDLGKALLHLGLASTTMQFLTLDEKLQLIRVSNILNQHNKNKLPHEDLPKFSKVVLDFTIKLATKLSRLKKAYSVP